MSTYPLTLDRRALLLGAAGAFGLPPLPRRRPQPVRSTPTSAALPQDRDGSRAVPGCGCSCTTLGPTRSPAWPSPRGSGGSAAFVTGRTSLADRIPPVGLQRSGRDPEAAHRVGKPWSDMEILGTTAKGLPSWVIDRIPGEEFVSPTGRGTFPVPWSSRALELRRDFEEHLASRYRDDPLHVMHRTTGFWPQGEPWFGGEDSGGRPPPLFPSSSAPSPHFPSPTGLRRIVNNPYRTTRSSASHTPSDGSGMPEPRSSSTALRAGDRPNRGFGVRLAGAPALGGPTTRAPGRRTGRSWSGPRSGSTHRSSR